jgi:hypothetical protein
MAELLEEKVLRQRISDDDWENRDLTNGVRPLSAVGYGALTGQTTLPFLDGKLLVTCDGPMPAWLPAVVAKLDELANLPPNWNSYRATRMRRPSMLAALQLLLAVMHDNTPSPAVVPTNRGTILLEWHKRGVDLEIDVLGPDRFHVVAEVAAEGTEQEFEAQADLTDIACLIERLS